jgi:hypothetical protein
MSSTSLTGILLAAGAMLAAGPALAQELELRPGTDNVQGEPGSLENVSAPAPIFGPVVEPGYVPPRYNGKPDLSGAWSNSTLTGVDRPAVFGTRAILTAEEAAIIEGANEELIARGNEATDPSATIKDIEAKDNCSGGRTGAPQGCNYDAGWTAPGDSVMRVNGQARTSLLTTPDGQYPEPIRQASAAERAAQARANVGEGTAESREVSRNDNPEGRGLAERCIAMSLARPPLFDSLYNSNHQIQMGKDHVVIVAEMIHEARIIRLNSEHRNDGIRPWFGDSIGWWEGDTLVVETTHFPSQQAYRGSWENLTVTERFTRVSNDRMNYQFEISDPTMWARPWGGEYEFWRSAPLYEYACHEGNYGLENILAGARAEEAAAEGREVATTPVNWD